VDTGELLHHREELYFTRGERRTERESSQIPSATQSNRILLVSDARKGSDTPGGLVKAKYFLYWTKWGGKNEGKVQRREREEGKDKKGSPGSSLSAERGLKKRGSIGGFIRCIGGGVFVYPQIRLWEEEEGGRMRKRGNDKFLGHA